MNEKKKKTTDSQNSAFVSNVATGFSVTQGTQAVDLGHKISLWSGSKPI